MDRNSAGAGDRCRGADLSDRVVPGLVRITARRPRAIVWGRPSPSRGRGRGSEHRRPREFAQSGAKEEFPPPGRQGVGPARFGSSVVRREAMHGDPGGGIWRPHRDRLRPRRLHHASEERPLRAEPVSRLVGFHCGRSIHVDSQRPLTGHVAEPIRRGGRDAKSNNSRFMPCRNGDLGPPGLAEFVHTPRNSGMAAAAGRREPPNVDWT